jgi:hypothetical protein
MCENCGGIIGEEFEEFAGTPCECLYKTHQYLLRDINQWIDSQDGSRIGHNIAQILRSARQQIRYEITLD